MKFQCAFAALLRQHGQHIFRGFIRFAKTICVYTYIFYVRKMDSCNKNDSNSNQIWYVYILQLHKIRRSQEKKNKEHKLK